jgi:hypothetical protein
MDDIGRIKHGQTFDLSQALDSGNRYGHQYGDNEDVVVFLF